MSAAAIRVDDHSVGFREFFLRRPFAVEVEFDVHLVRRALFEAFFEKLDARVVLMLAGTVRGLARDHDDGFLVRGKRGTGEGNEDEEGKQALHGGGEGDSNAPRHPAISCLLLKAK
jgi:hypothetical protein